MPVRPDPSISQGRVAARSKGLGGVGAGLRYLSLNGRWTLSPSDHGEQAALAEQRRAIAVVHQLFAVVGLDTLHLVGRTEHEADALMKALRRRLHQAMPPGAGHAA